MKTFKLLTICCVVCCLFSSNVFAACTVQLDDSIFPNNGVFNLGDTIEYEITLAIPPNNGTEFCELPLFEAHFLNPTLFSGVNACTDPNTIPILAVNPLAPGDSYDFDSSIIPELSYQIMKEDLVQIPGLEGWYIVAKLCSSWLPDSDTKTVYNRVLAEPCIEVSKTACEYSKVGDDVTYTIRIENCGDTDLLLLSVDDSLLGDLTATALSEGCDTLAVGEFCEFDVMRTVLEGDPDPLINQVTVEYESTFDQAVVEANDIAEVDLLHPSYTVAVDCNGIINGTAYFDVVITNTGDVDLDIDPQDAQLPLLSPLGVGKSSVSLVSKDITGVCGGGSATYTVDAIGTIPPEYCNLPNVLPESDSATCTDDVNPDFTVEKNCLTDPVPADSNAIFEIIITNTGDVALAFDVNDVAAGINTVIGPVEPGNDYRMEVQISAECIDGVVSNSVTVTGYCRDATIVDEITVTADCGCGGIEGCTPGYWKNSPDCWCDAYDPTMKLCTVFDLNCDTTPNTFFEEMGQKKMLKALSFKGGSKKKYKFRILLKHATAALLNACNDNVDYPVSETYILDSVNHIINNWGDYSKTDILNLKKEFDMYNNLGCPISADNSANPCSRNVD